MPESVSRAQVEPSTVNMQHDFFRARIFRAAPDAVDTSYMASVVGHALRRRHMFHDAVEGDAGGRPSHAPLVGLDDRSHGDHRSGVLGIDRMEYGPGSDRVALLLKLRLHVFLLRNPLWQRLPICFTRRKE